MSTWTYRWTFLSEERTNMGIPKYHARLIPATALLLLSGCGTMNPAALIEHSIKSEVTVKGRAVDLTQCMVNKIDGFEVYAMGGNDTAAQIRPYPGRLEIYLSPSLTVLEDRPEDTCHVTAYVYRSYWKQADLSSRIIEFARECSLSNQQM